MRRNRQFWEEILLKYQLFVHIFPLHILPLHLFPLHILPFTWFVITYFTTTYFYYIFYPLHGFPLHNFLITLLIRLPIGANLIWEMKKGIFKETPSHVGCWPVDQHVKALFQEKKGFLQRNMSSFRLLTHRSSSFSRRRVVS